MAGKVGWQFFNEALERAAWVATERAALCKKTRAALEEHHPGDRAIAAREASAQYEAELIARDILALKKSPRKRRAG